MDHVAATSNGHGTTTYGEPTYRYHQVQHELHEAMVPIGMHNLRENNNTQDHEQVNLGKLTQASQSRKVNT